MLNKIRYPILCLAVMFALGCGITHSKITSSNGSSLKSGAKIKVADVYNDTGQVSDVDTIGLCWDALRDTLRRENLAWTPDTTGTTTTPLLLYAHIVKYQKGNIWQRYLLPGSGSTVLGLRCNLLENGQEISKIEAQGKIGTGEGLTIDAWKNVFAKVAEDIVHDLQKKMCKNADVWH